MKGPQPIDPRLLEFIRLFNQKYFFEAHEILEDLWLESEGEVKDFYKGLIQCAVAFVHLQRGNFRGAKKLFRTSAGYLRRYPPAYKRVDTAKLTQEFKGFFTTIVRDAEKRGERVDVENTVTPIITLVRAPGVRPFPKRQAND